MSPTQIVRAEKQNEVMFMCKHNGAATGHFRCQTKGFFFFLSLFFLLVFGEAVPLLILEVSHGIEEKFIPEKGKSRGQRSL